MTYQVIYKYPVDLGQFIRMMPKGAEVLCVQIQGSIPQIWALVDPDEEEEERKFVMVLTGASFPKPSRYVGTFQAPPFVWHVFEIWREN